MDIFIKIKKVLITFVDELELVASIHVNSFNTVKKHSI